MANNESNRSETNKRNDDAQVVPHPRTSEIRGYGRGIDTDSAEASEYRRG